MGHRSKKVGYGFGRVLLAALLALGIARPAQAGPPIEPVELSYRAPEACPSFSQFLGEVQRSTARLRLARAGEPARHFEVVIEASGREGHLALDGGSKGEREVVGAECGEVAGLLAFAAALAADPEAQPPPDGKSGVAAFPAVNPSSGVAAEAKPQPAPAAIVTTPSPPGSASIGRAPRAHDRRKWSVADFGFATGASAPAVTFGGGLFGELELSAVGLTPRFRIGLSYAQKSVSVASGSVSVVNELVTVETCSGALQRDTVTFLPCLRAQAGARLATGHDVPQASSSRRGFLDVGLASHLRWRFAGPGFVEVGGALLFPTVRDHVFIRQGTAIYDVPALGGLGELALGVEFGDQSPD